jgi:hypothetical protein
MLSSKYGLSLVRITKFLARLALPLALDVSSGAASSCRLLLASFGLPLSASIQVLLLLPLLFR